MQPSWRCWGLQCINYTNRQRISFLLGSFYDADFTKSVVKQLNDETGLDFGGVDIARFGDLEMLVFPTLDDLERNLLDVNWAENPLALVVRFDPVQVAQFQTFQFHLRIKNNGLILYSTIIAAKANATGLFECNFLLGEQLRAITDEAELEIFGCKDSCPHEATLCCRWRGGYIREVVLQAHVIGHTNASIKFDWLEKTTRRSAIGRAKAALAVNRGSSQFATHVGGRAVDLWVKANRNLVSLFERLHPSTSQGQFFMRWGPSREGRLELVEWLRALLTKYGQNQVIIFDPHFDTAGLSLLLILGAVNADFIVFTSLKKQNGAGSNAAEGDVKAGSDRINNLVASCRQNHHLIKRFKLRIYGLKDGRLHDRYILILGQDALPIAGFNVSNSLQLAAENHPLLITPIPADILLKVEQYKVELVREAEAASTSATGDAPSIPLIFDSMSLPKLLRHYEPLLFLEKAAAGDVLSAWTRELSLRSLSGSLLNTQLTALGMLKDGSLILPEMKDFNNFLTASRNILPLNTIWDVLGDVLAHSSTNGDHLAKLKGDDDFLEFLTQFLIAAFNRVYDKADEEVAACDPRFFREPIETLLHSSYRPDHFAGRVKFQILTWSETYAIRLLWLHLPETLCGIAEAKMASAPQEPQGQNVVLLSLLSQILSEFAQTVLFGGGELQQDTLLYSRNGLLRWMGLIALERKMARPGELSGGLQKLATFSRAEQMDYLGWMVSRAARDSKEASIYPQFLSSLILLLPHKLSSEDLKNLIDSLRGHVRELGSVGPWLFNDVVFPLLQEKRVEFDYACDIWIQELVVSLGPGYENQFMLFDRSRGGQTTNIAAFLFAQSSIGRQRSSLKLVSDLITRQRRTIQQPLANTANWTRWNAALVVTTWLLCFTRWCQYYIRQQDGPAYPELDDLAREAADLAEYRPINEWRSTFPGPHKELQAFLDEVNKLLAPSGKL